MAAILAISTAASIVLRGRLRPFAPLPYAVPLHLRRRAEPRGKGVAVHFALETAQDLVPQVHKKVLAAALAQLPGEISLSELDVPGGGAPAPFEDSRSFRNASVSSMRIWMNIPTPTKTMLNKNGIRQP